MIDQHRDHTILSKAGRRSCLMSRQRIRMEESESISGHYPSIREDQIIRTMKDRKQDG
jgi:hypothetical protein